MKTTVHVLAFALLTFPCAVFGQASFQIPITVSNGADTTILRIGINPGNTIGMDTLSSLGQYREVPAPPAPPAPFAWDARLVTIPGRVSTFPVGLSGGVIKDFRGYVSSTQVDTFKIKIDGDNTDAASTIVSWPGTLAQFATAWLIKPQTGSDWLATDMLANGSVTIPAGLQKNILIIKTGAMGTTGVGLSTTTSPTRYELAQNFPNPFNPATSISFALPRSGSVRLKVFSLLGQEVETLVDDIVPAGVHVVRFDGRSLSSGMYIYRLEADGFVQTRAMMLLK
jgi:hypothetical protein